MRIKWTNNKVDHWLLSNNTQIKRQSHFTSVHDRSCWVCLICKVEWITSFQNIKGRGTRCPSCSAKKQSDQKRFIDETYFDSFLVKYNTNMKRVGKFKGIHDPVTLRCDCGHIWETVISNVLYHNHKCPFCSNRKKLMK